MNTADFYKAIVSAWPLLNDLLLVGVAVSLIVVTLTCVFREFGTRKLRYM